MKNGSANHGKDVEVDLKKYGFGQEIQINAKSELIDSMVYQIRTLSNAVIGFSELLMTEPLSDDQCEYIREINDAGQNLSILAGDVLDWTQLLSGKFSITNKKSVLKDIIRILERHLSAAVQEKGFDCQVTADPKLPEYICCDESKLLKCLISLIANAVAHTENGSVRVHVRLDAAPAGPFICFDIADDGVGIPPEKINGLFDITDQSLQVNEKALSLVCGGLAVRMQLPLIKLICDALGGTLEVSSERNVGSVFSLRIPTAAKKQTTPELETPARVNTATERSQEFESVPSGKILLVEDQPSNRAVISLILESLDVQAETAEDGLAALEKAKDNYDLIIMDLKMPNMDGFEAAQCLREQGCEIPIVAMSAKVLNETEHRRIMSIFDGFLTKPVSRSQIAEVVGRYSKITAQPTNEMAFSVVSGDHNNENTEQ